VGRFHCGALRKYQSAHGLSPTGKLDALTLEKLGLGSETAGVQHPRLRPMPRPTACFRGARSGMKSRTKTSRNSAGPAGARRWILCLNSENWPFEKADPSTPRPERGRTARGRKSRAASVGMTMLREAEAKAGQSARGRGFQRFARRALPWRRFHPRQLPVRSVFAGHPKGGAVLEVARETQGRVGGEPRRSATMSAIRVTGTRRSSAILSCSAREAP